MESLVGTWDVVVHTFMGDQFSKHELYVEGNIVSGVIMDKGNGNKAEVREGRIEGNKFSYKFTIKIPVGELEFTVEGQIIEGNRICGTSSNAMGSFEFEGKK